MKNQIRALLCLLLSACLLAASAAAFSDVPEGSWYHDAVETVRANGLMNGVDAARFDPDGSTTRATIVTVLYRHTGSPKPRRAAAFADVADGSWYADAVAWAAENSIVLGYSNGGFGADDPITREQMAAIFCRYTAYLGEDVSRRAELSAYADAASVSAYARDAMAWAVAVGLLQGVSASELAPSGTASRSQTAAILARFLTITRQTPAETVEPVPASEPEPEHAPVSEPEPTPEPEPEPVDDVTIELPLTD